MGKVLSNNPTTANTLNGTAVVIGLVNLTVTTPATSGAQVSSIDVTTGVVSVPPNTPAGSYTIVYSICDKLNSANCVTATVTVTVTALVIDAVTETTTSINGLVGGTTAALVVNDTLNGTPVVIGTNPGQVTLTGITVPTGLTLNADGTVTVAPNTPAGNYNVEYKICEVTNPLNCDTVTSVVVVSPSAIVAQDDYFFEGFGFTGKPDLGNVMDDNGYGFDTINATNVDIAKVTMTITTPAAPIAVGEPVPSIDVTTGVVSVLANTPAGKYTIVYTICEKLNPANCDSATVTIEVADPAPAPPTIFADDDTVGSIDGIKGAAKVVSILSNDFIAQTPATINNVTIRIVTPDATGSLILNPDGTVDVKAGTPAGTYTFVYEVCTKTAPIVCAQATVIITVVTPVIVANNNDFSATPIDSSKGMVLDILANDTISGSVVMPSQVVISVVDAAGLNGINIDNQGKMVIPVGTPIGTYVITYRICDVINPNNCATATVTIVVKDPCDFDDSPASCDIEIHNAITPNNDGQNEVFSIDRIENYPENTVEIYNRWGVLVYEEKGYNNTSKVFIGISEGRVTVNKAENLPDGTYYYIVKYKKPISKTMKQKAGFLYLKR